MYMCSRCLLAEEADTPCPQCGRRRMAIRPGDEADAGRRPWIDSEGNVRTRAPVWWLRVTVANLTQWWEGEAR